MKKQDILKELEKTTEQINKFRKRLRTSDLCEDLYDEAILKKAILMKELETCDQNPILEGLKKGLKKGTSKILPKEKKLICDYFNG